MEREVWLADFRDACFIGLDINVPLAMLHLGADEVQDGSQWQNQWMQAVNKLCQ